MFWLSPIEEQSNVAPTILQSSPDQGDTLVIDLDQFLAFVRVTDENDQDSLTYVWSIEPGGGTISHVLMSDENGSQSVVTLEKKSEYDGRILRCTVYDGYGESATRQWDIEVEGGQ